MNIRNEVIRVLNEVLRSSKEITELPAASALSGPELFEAVQGGINVRVTASQIANFTGGGGGGGTVTSFSSGNLSPLFTTSVTTPTTTPALSFTLSNQSANTVFAGPTSGGAAAPTFRTLVVADIPSLSSLYQPINTAWLLANGGALTGVNTITSNAAVQMIFTGTWTAVANNQNHVRWTGSITARATASDSLNYFVLDPTIIAAAATQTLTALLINPTFTPGAFSPTMYLVRIQKAGTDRMTVTDTGNYLFQTEVSGTYATFRNATTIHFRFNDTGSVFMGNTSSARIGSATNGSATFSVSSGSIAYQADVSHFFTTQTATTITLGNGTKHQFSGTIDATGGSNTGIFYRLAPTYNISASVAAIVYDFLIEPTETALANTTHYGIVNPSTTAMHGLGTLTPTARLQIVGANNSVALLVEDDSGNDILSLGESGGARVIGAFGSTPVGQQVSAANLTNNVTSGGTDNQIDNFTDLTTYSNDAATIRNDIYQLARKLKQINDGLRSYGLFT